MTSPKIFENDTEENAVSDVMTFNHMRPDARIAWQITHSDQVTQMGTGISLAFEARLGPDAPWVNTATVAITDSNVSQAGVLTLYPYMRVTIARTEGNTNPIDMWVVSAP